MLRNVLPLSLSGIAFAREIGHALTGSFTLDVYGHTLDWTASEDAAKRLGEEIAKAVAAVERKQQFLDSAHLSAHQKENSQSRQLGSH
jgi:hypothetical protein